MQMGIFLEYNSYVDEIKNRLLMLYNKFQRCHYLLENDYQKGLINKEEYDYIRKLYIFNYDERIPSMYQLSKEEVEYLRSYGKFNASGLLLLDMVNDSITKKQNNFNCIEKSIRIFYHYDNLDEKRRKDLFIEEINKTYMPEFTSCEEEIARLKVALGENYYQSLTYQKIKEKLRVLTQEKDKLIADVLKSNFRQFMQTVETFYGINLEYYNWYKRRYIKEECEKEISTMDQESQIDIVKNRTLEVSENLEQVKKLNEEIAGTTNLMISLTSELVKDGFEESSVKKKVIFNRKKKMVNSNQEDLREIFGYYGKYSGFIQFIKYFIETDEEISLVETFDKYYAKVYGSCSYVEPHLFKKRLVLEMINYFKEMIDEKNEQLKGIMILLSSDSDMLSSQIEEIKAHEIVRKYYDDNCDDLNNVDETLLELGFSAEEIMKMYEDMKNFVNTNLTKEYLEGPILNLKVGN